MKRNDNIGVALAILAHHGYRYALTGGLVRRLVSLATGRPDHEGGQWSTGWQNLVRKRWVTCEGNPFVHGHSTWTLTAKGRERALKSGGFAVGAEACDPWALIGESAQRYLREDAIVREKRRPHGPAMVRFRELVVEARTIRERNRADYEDDSVAYVLVHDRADRINAVLAACAHAAVERFGAHVAGSTAVATCMRIFLHRKVQGIATEPQWMLKMAVDESERVRAEARGAAPFRSGALGLIDWQTFIAEAAAEASS